MPRSDPPFNRLFNLVRGWPALTEKIVAGVQLVQEDSPDEIGKAIADWMGTLGGRGSAGVTVFAGTRCVQPTKPLPAYEAPPHLCLESDLELNSQCITTGSFGILSIASQKRSYFSVQQGISAVQDAGPQTIVRGPAQ